MTPTDTAEDHRARFLEAGLPYPATARAARGLRLVDDWHLTTRPDGSPSPYRVEEHVDGFLAGEADDYLVLAHAGHGLNSWAISYLSVQGPVGVFVQSAWGGATTGPEKDRREVARMEERFVTADALLAAPTGRLAEGERLVAVESDLGRTAWAVVRAGEEPTWRSSSSPLADALAHLRG